MDRCTILVGDALEQLALLPDSSVQCCVTSPPYWGLRDYGVEGQIGLEKSPDEYVSKLVAVFREVRRVLKKDGTLWLNLGDSYAGSGKARGQGGMGYSICKQKTNRGAYFQNQTPVSVNGCKPKDLIGIPWRVAFALQSDGWWLRCDIIWSKPNPMPESVLDRPTRAHEYIFLMGKSARYYYDADSVRVPYSIASISRYESPLMGTAPCGRKPNGNVERRHSEKAIRDPNPLGRNCRSVWQVTTNSFDDAHFATYPPDLIKPCILAGSRAGDAVLDPFGGSGTTGQVALELGRKAILIELNPDYARLIEQRTNVTPGLAL